MAACYTHGCEMVTVFGVKYCPECYPNVLPYAEMEATAKARIEPDTDRPPPPPAPHKRCYWCNSDAVTYLYHGIPSCSDCHDRALRSSRR